MAADLDGDGRKEILFQSYDGRLHAYWLDRTEHGSWPFRVTRSGEGFIRFGSEPAVVDLDNDGLAEVIFTTWTQKGSNAGGQLLILRWNGALLQVVDLPRDTSQSWDGAMAAPTVADIDGDSELEVVVGTAHTGLVVYDLPGSSNGRILWGTGRGGNLRSGAAPAGTLPHTVTITVGPTGTPNPAASGQMVDARRDRARLARPHADLRVERDVPRGARQRRHVERSDRGSADVDGADQHDRHRHELLDRRHRHRRHVVGYGRLHAAHLGRRPALPPVLRGGSDDSAVRLPVRARQRERHATPP